MKVSIGIDIGGSATKAAAFCEDGSPAGTLFISASDPRTCAYGALGRFLDERGLALSNVERIVLTGLGSTCIRGDLYGLPTLRVPELEAIGRGGLALSGLSEALVVSMGTGTALVRAARDGYRHLGGSGIGGGTLTGLAGALLGVRDTPALAKLAASGDCSRTDLRIGDLLGQELPDLNGELTAANFGKIKDGAADSDVAAALFNMIYENAGVMASLALSGDTIKDVVVTGTLASLAPAAVTFGVFNRLQSVFGLRFIIPENAAFATATGALLCAPSRTPGV